MNPAVIFENQYLFAVDKPAGMIVNKADTAKRVVTLQDWVEETYHISEKQVEDTERFLVNGYNKYDEFISRSGIVHRLDKETSGIMLVAKDVQTFIELQNQFKTSQVTKTYTAFVHGRVEEIRGEINAPISRLPWNRMRFGVNKDGRESNTQYAVLEYKKLPSGETGTLMEVYPKTGRTHQIRVHFQHIRHPIFADELYAGRKTARDDRKILSRQFLHASKICFINPDRKEKITLESQLPQELSSFLNSLSAIS